MSHKHHGKEYLIVRFDTRFHSESTIIRTFSLENLKDGVIQSNQSFEIIETLLEIIKRTLESGEDVIVGGFGVIVRRPDETSATENSLGRQRPRTILRSYHS
jgi:hypothetical protein